MGGGGGEAALGPVGSVTPRGAKEAAEWQSRARACVSPSRLPETAQLRSRHLMAKVEETGAGSRAGAAPRPPLDSGPRRGLPLKVQELFPGFESRPPRPRWGSFRRRSDAARLPALHLTRRPKSRAAGLLPAPSPLPAAVRYSCSREGSGGERAGGAGERGLGGSAGSRAPGKCLNNRTGAAAPVGSAAGRWAVAGDWSCSLGLPGAERGRTKTRPAPAAPAAGPRTLPFLLSTPAVPGKLGGSRPRPRATALPSLAAADAFFLTTVCGSHRRHLHQPPPAARSPDK